MTAPRRILTLWDATCVVIGAIIGVGIFFTPQDVAKLAGSATGSLLAWAIGGVVALLGAFTFAELGRLKPHAGGQYHVLREAFGRAPAFLFVFCNLTAIQTGGVAIIALIFAQNLGIALHGADPSPTWIAVLATAAVAALALLNVIGVRSGSRVQDVTVILKLLTLGGLVALAAFYAPGEVLSDPAAPAPLGFGNLFAAVTITLFAYGGWQQALWMADEVVDAPRVLPRAIVIGVVIVVAAYLAANVAFLRQLGIGGLKTAKSIVAASFDASWHAGGGRIAAGAVAASAFGVLNAQFLTGPRLTWAMAKDGQFFSPFARLHPRFATPAPAILLLAVLATAMMLGLGLGRTDVLTTGVVVVDATFFALTGVALPILRARTPAGERGPAWISACAVAFAVLELLSIVGSVLTKDVRLVALTGLGWIAVGFAVWRGWFSR